MESIYSEKPGRKNTLGTLKKAFSTAKELNIDTIVVSSTTGESALETIKIFDESYQLIIVTHQDGFRDIGNEFPVSIKEEILQKRPSTIFHTGTHAFAGLERSFRIKHKTWLPIEMIAITLRKCFGEGTKVTMEMAIMVSDAGLIDTTKEIISIAGTGRGLDTAWIIKPSYSNKLFELKMKVLICKPKDF
ncbi:MAG: pyruvate kinase alpha/beta domain-containing protein [Candidatus Hodarchaeota archaeon]